MFEVPTYKAKTKITTEKSNKKAVDKVDKGKKNPYQN